MKALIMAGGKGTRLHPYSATLPKPLMPVGDVPVLEILLRQMRQMGVDEVILGVNHLRLLIEAYFGDGSRYGIKISYSGEDKPLGTAGPIGLVLDQLDGPFLVTNGDLLTTLRIDEMVHQHRSSGAAATVGAYRREVKSDFGILDVDAEMRLVGYREKPTYSHLVSMGIYVLEPEVVRPHLEPGGHLDMPDLLRAIVAKGGHVHCHESDCFWLDIGRPEDLSTAQRLVEENPRFFLRDD
jgi:NDP-sugar pyrophosphorylase family protein